MTERLGEYDMYIESMDELLAKSKQDAYVFSKTNSNNRIAAHDMSIL